MAEAGKPAPDAGEVLVKVPVLVETLLSLLSWCFMLTAGTR
jgi:hypothetical protein